MSQFASEPAVATSAFKPPSSNSRPTKGSNEPETPFASLLDSVSQAPSQDDDDVSSKPPMNENSAKSPSANDDPPAGRSKSAGTDKPTGTDKKQTASSGQQSQPDQIQGNTTADQSADTGSATVKQADQCKDVNDIVPADKSGSEKDKKTADACKSTDGPAQALTDASVVADVSPATPAPVVPPAPPVPPAVAAPVVALPAPQTAPDAHIVVSAAATSPIGADNGTDSGAAADIIGSKLLKNVAGAQGKPAKMTSDATKTPTDQSPSGGSQPVSDADKEQPASSALATTNGSATKDVAQVPAENRQNDTAKNTDARAGSSDTASSNDTPRISLQTLSSDNIGFAANAGAPQTQQIGSGQSAVTSQPPASPAMTPVAIPVVGLAVEIAGRALAGKNHFEIRLDPPELGRIDVHLNVDRDGQVTSHLVVDRSDTLNLLRQDSTGLERALQDAGLRMSDSGLQFSLRDQTMNQNANQQAATPTMTRVIVPDDASLSAELPQRVYSRLAGMGGGLDIRV